MSLNLSSTPSGSSSESSGFNWAARADRDPPGGGRARHRVPRAEDPREAPPVPGDAPGEVGRREGSPAVLRHPKKVVLLLGGNLVAQVMLAIILGVCLRAFGHSASLAALILVNTFVSLFAGFMPVPGGVGVAEAGYTAGLIAIGIPEGAATSTALGVPARHVLPAAAVGRVRDAVDEAAVVPLGRGALNGCCCLRVGSAERSLLRCTAPRMILIPTPRRPGRGSSVRRRRGGRSQSAVRCRRNRRSRRPSP